MLNPKDYYVSYLLRLRQIQTDNRFTWVASVQNTATGEQSCFAGVEALVEFLRAKFITEPPGPNSDQPAGPLHDGETPGDEKEWRLPL